MVASPHTPCDPLIDAAHDGGKLAVSFVCRQIRFYSFPLSSRASAGRLEKAERVNQRALVGLRRALGNSNATDSHPAIANCLGMLERLKQEKHGAEVAALVNSFGALRRLGAAA